MITWEIVNKQTGKSLEYETYELAFSEYKRLTRQEHLDGSFSQQYNIMSTIR